MVPNPPEEAPLAGAGSLTFAISGRSDVAIARHRAQHFARALGFGARREAEIAIVVSELASNIVKYGVRGDMTLSPGEDGRSLVVVARDVGPPIHDLDLALQDGFDDRGPIDPSDLLKRGGLGTGLGAICRMTDGFDLRQGDGGKEITVMFRLPPAPP